MRFFIFLILFAALVALIYYIVIYFGEEIFDFWKRRMVKYKTKIDKKFKRRQ